MDEKNNHQMRILIVAGEASGDKHGANLVQAMREQSAFSLSFFGVGGRELRSSGVEILSNSEEITAVGITEALAHLHRARRVYRKIQGRIRSHPPHLAILIDSPGFNLRLAKVLKERNIPVMYYIAPQVWAWGRGRVKHISRRVDRLVSILPFEEDFFRGSGVAVDFVGHPLLDLVKPARNPAGTREKFRVKQEERVITLLPGSRPREISFLLPEMLRAVGMLCARRSGLVFLLPVASSLDPQLVSSFVASHRAGSAVRVLPGEEVYDALAVSEVAMVASGTATLEAALLQCPMVILYRVSRTSYWIGRMVVTVKHLGLVNVIAGREVVPELLQKNVRADRIASEIENLLDHPELREQMRAALGNIKSSLGEPGAARRAAAIALQVMSLPVGSVGSECGVVR